MASIEKRISKTGAVSYRAMVRMRGFPPKSATFEKKADARDWAHGIEADMRAGKYGADLIAQKYTVADMIRRYVDTVLENKTDNAGFIETQRTQLEWWAGRLASCRLNNLTPFLINDCKDELAGRNFRLRAPGTVNRYLAALNHVINTAVKEWGWMAANPISKISKPKEPQGRARFLADSERDALLAACKLETRKPLYLIVLMALSTGARKSEILNMKVKDVDLARQVAVAYDTKNGDNRQLYLYGRLCDLLAEHMKKPRAKSSLLFPSRTGYRLNIEEEWRRALRRAGIEDFRFHDLRHTAASYMAMNGASPGEIGEALGHKSYDMVKRYAHLSTTHVGGVVRAMNEKIFGQQEGAQA